MIKEMSDRKYIIWAKENILSEEDYLLLIKSRETSPQGFMNAIENIKKEYLSRQKKPKTKKNRKIRVDPIAEKAKEVKAKVKSYKDKYHQARKMNMLDAYDTVQSKKYDSLEESTLILYTETEEIVTEREKKYLEAKELVKELNKQMPLIRDDIKYYKSNHDIEKVNGLEAKLSNKLKKLGKAENDFKHYAPKSKKFFNYVGGALVVPFKAIGGLFIAPKEVELTAEQMVRFGVI